MKKWVIWTIVGIIFIIVAFMFLSSSFRYSTQVLVDGKNIFTGNCATFATPAEMPFYYKTNHACVFARTIKEIIKVYGTASKEEIASCNNFNDKDKKIILKYLNITSCEELK